MRMHRALAAFALQSACAGARVGPRRECAREVIVTSQDAGASASADDPLPLADWMPAFGAPSTVVRTTERATWLIDGPFRAVVHDGGRIEVARDRTRLPIAHWFSLEDDRWVFVTVDGLVVSSRGFTGAFETRAELGSTPSAGTESGFVGAPVVRTVDGAWWVLDDPARPRQIRSWWAESLFAVRFYDRERALALTSPGVVLHSDDGARSWARLSMDGDAPIALEGRSDRRVVVRGLRGNWAVDRRGVFGRVVRETSAAPIDEALARRASERWSAHAWRFAPSVFVDPLYPSVARIGSTQIYFDGGELRVLRARGESEVRRGDRASECAMLPFGAALAALCRSGSEATRLRRIHVDPVSVDPIEDPGGLDHFDVFARDGSVIAHTNYGSNELRVWTPRLGWRSFPRAVALELLDAADGQLFGANAQGLFSLQVDQEGPPSLREIARFDADGGAGYERALASNANGALRAWVLANAESTRCAVLLEDSHGASTIELPRCSGIQSVQFIDRRFGVVTTEDSFLVTRDARMWRTHTRDVVTSQGAPRRFAARLGGLSWPASRPYVHGDAIIVPPWHRVARDGAQVAWAASRNAVAASVEPAERPPLVPPTTLSCSVRSSRAEARASGGGVVMMHATSRVELRTMPGNLASIRWSLDGRERASWQGPRPWDAATEPSNERWRIVCASDRGVIVERCIDRDDLASMTPPDCTPLLLRAGASSPVALRLDALPSVQTNGVTYCRWADDRWNLELDHSRSDTLDIAQYQQRDADGALIASQDIVRNVRDQIMVGLRPGMPWWAQTSERIGQRIVPYLRGFEAPADRIESLTVCLGTSSDDEIMYVPSARGVDAYFELQTIPLSLVLRRSRIGYCIESAVDVSASTSERAPSQPNALSLLASRDGRLRGTWTSVSEQGAITRAELECALPDHSSTR
ncbi:MAG: hypothetical protein U0269_32860 [Polyangiales bacterium]